MVYIHYDTVKRTVNYLDVILTDPRYKALFEVKYYSHKGNESISSKFKEYYYYRRQLSKTSWEKENHIGLKTALDCTYIFKWIKNQNITLELEAGKYVWKGKKQFALESSDTISFSSLDDLATFKYWVETTLLTRLKEQYPSNSFINQLYVGSIKHPFGSWATTLVLPINFSMVDNVLYDVNYDRNKYLGIVKDFEAIKSTPMDSFNIKFNGSDMTLQDVLFLYHLIADRGSNTSNNIGNLFYSQSLNDGGDLRKKFKKDEAEVDKNNTSYAGISSSLLKDIEKMSAPVVYENTSEPPIGFSYYKLIQGGKVSISTRRLDFDGVSEEASPYTKLETYDRNTLNFYTLPIGNYEELEMIQDLLNKIPTSSDNLGDIKEIFNSLIKYNKLIFKLNC